MEPVLWGLIWLGALLLCSLPALLSRLPLPHLLALTVAGMAAGALTLSATSLLSPLTSPSLATLLIPLLEEAVKAGTLTLLLTRLPLTAPRPAVLLVPAGFASFETVLYAFPSLPSLLARTLLSLPLHLASTTLWARPFLAAPPPRTLPAHRGLLLAWALHLSYNLLSRSRPLLGLAILPLALLIITSFLLPSPSRR
ncbi:PrsW family glutamic-type intramembrane protease [Spirochaeta thermophila]|uniref:PrsW family glutamic-type intramembrane protease n=1 Tax=Winmispira thermophila TaxID=154 RepID=UPI00030A67B1|nr:PrsW family glutamic-type intramembrane protease [Spirochaeta thermophila]